MQEFRSPFTAWLTSGSRPPRPWPSLLVLLALTLLSSTTPRAQEVVPPEPPASARITTPSPEEPGVAGPGEEVWVEDPERVRRDAELWTPAEYRRALRSTGMADHLATTPHRRVESAPKSRSVWVRRGPVGGFGNPARNGRIAGVQVVPDGGVTWTYAGACQGGLWVMSSSAPAQWTDISVTLPNPSVRALLVDPRNRQRILVGTGDHRRYTGAGMFRTTDGGLTWTEVSIPIDPSYFYRLLYRDDGTYQTILAASSTGMLRSSDGGQTWALAALGGGGDADGVWTDVRAHPSDPDVFYACRYVNGGESGRGVFLSSDAGQTWFQIGQGDLPGGSDWDRATLAICESAPGTLAVMVENDASLQGVFRSEDAGATWSDITGDLVRPGDDYTFGGNQIFHAQALTFHPDDPDWLLVGGIGLALTTDGGQTWSIGQSQHGIERGHADLTQMLFLDDDTLYLANDGGLYLHTLSTSTTSDMLGDASTGLACTEIDFLDADRLVRGIGTQDNGSVLTVDGGQTWEFLGGGDGADLEIFDPQAGHVWLNWGAAPWNTYRKYYGQSVEFSDNPDKYMPRLFYRRADDRVYTHDGTSIYSTSATASPLQGWTEEVSGLQPGDYNIRGIAGSNAGDLSLYATYWNSGVANGRDLTVVTREGGTWQINHVEDLAPSAGTLQRVAVSELWPGQAWVGVSTPPGDPKLLHTTDGGDTWEDLTANLADLPRVRTVVPMPHDPGILFVGTELGVYRSTDGGASWSPFMDGLPVARTAELRLIADPQHTGAWQLVLGTDGKGVWSRTVAAPPVIFVDQDASGFEDGTIWHPFDTLQEALAAAPAGAVIALRRDEYQAPQTLDQDVRLVSWGGGTSAVLR
jgi:photosystem II stability/assembly factor-like uncharacterized protein